MTRNIMFNYDRRIVQGSFETTHFHKLVFSIANSFEMDHELSEVNQDEGGLIVHYDHFGQTDKTNSEWFSGIKFETPVRLPQVIDRENLHIDGGSFRPEEYNIDNYFGTELMVPDKSLVNKFGDYRNSQIIHFFIQGEERFDVSYMGRDDKLQFRSMQAVVDNVAKKYSKAKVVSTNSKYDADTLMISNMTPLEASDLVRKVIKHYN